MEAVFLSMCYIIIKETGLYWSCVHCFLFIYLSPLVVQANRHPHAVSFRMCVQLSASVRFHTEAHKGWAPTIYITFTWGMRSAPPVYARCVDISHRKHMCVTIIHHFYLGRFIQKPSESWCRFWYEENSSHFLSGEAKYFNIWRYLRHVSSLFTVMISLQVAFTANSTLIGFREVIITHHRTTKAEEHCF